MGALLDTATALDVAHHMKTYVRKQVLFVEGDGMRLVDDEGREYLDFVSGLGVMNLGHSHPAVAAAVCEQVGRLTHVSNLYHVEHQGMFAKAVSDLVGGDRRVFFANSGAEANEGAIKLARRWGKTHKGDACVGVITALNGFHGRTLATLAATGQPSKHAPFEPMPTGFFHVPLNDLDALEAAIGPDTCAVMLEPIQGEGGVHPCTPEYLSGVSEMCAAKDVLLVLDEIQTGCWRTGAAFAHHAYDISPDILTAAKALANGLPVGAVVADREVASSFVPGDHGSTFGGGPVVCAAGVATLAALADEGLGANAERIGAYLRDGLLGLANTGSPITEVRGAGLMIAAQVEGVDAAIVADHALDRGFVLNNIGSDIIRFLPPLMCGKAEVDAVLAMFEELLGG